MRVNMNLAQTQKVLEKLALIEAYAKSIGVGFAYQFEIDNVSKAIEGPIWISSTLRLSGDSLISPATDQ
jgi:hypothetical protein